MYLTPANFRAESLLASACAGLTLTAEEAPTADLTNTILTASQRVDWITNDHFEPQAALVLEQDNHAWTDRLYLTKRCTVATTVKTRDSAGTLTTQAATVYRLHSSLDPAGAVRHGDLDFLEVVPGSLGLAATDWAWHWPRGVNAVQVTGNFGWTTTPVDIQRAVAIMVWDVYKREAGDVRRASRWARGDLTVERDRDSETGLPEVDDILKSYTRKAWVGAR